MKLGDLAATLSAQLDAVSAEVEYTRLVTDSRQVVAGDVFFAIVGEQFDGHDHAAEAIAKGAVAAVVARKVGVPSLLVSDPLVAYGRAAAAHRAALAAQVIGVTGSTGKTSTKDLLAGILEQFGTTVAPPGSFNNEVGLPSTVLAATAETQFLVLEMGMRGLGQIDYLCSIAKPTIGVITNVGSAHQELLGTREAVLSAKAELVRSLPGNGVAVLLADDPSVLALRTELDCHTLTFGQSEGADVAIRDLELDALARPTFNMVYAGQTVRVALRVSGEHQALNAAAAVAAAVAAGLDFSAVAAALCEVEPRSRWRMEVSSRADGVTIVNDAYNANPESMRAGLKALKAMASGRRTWAVLGEMRELGADTVMADDEIGRLCVRLDISRLVAVGPAGKLLQIGAREEGSWGNEATWVPDVESAIDLLRAELLPGDIVFVKASRAIGLERVAEALLTDGTGENPQP